MVPFESLSAVSYLHPIVTMSEIKRDIGRNRDFSITHAFEVPVRGSPSQYCHIVWLWINKNVWLPDDEKSLIIRLVVLTQYWRVTDRRTS